MITVEAEYDLTDPELIGVKITDRDIVEELVKNELAVGDVVIGTHITTDIAEKVYTDSAYFNFSAAAGITGLRIRAKDAPSDGTDTTVGISSITIEAA